MQRRWYRYRYGSRCAYYNVRSNLTAYLSRVVICEEYEAVLIHGPEHHNLRHAYHRVPCDVAHLGVGEGHTARERQHTFPYPC